MTEKELLYIEDAVNHEAYILKTLKDAEECLMDEDLIKLMKKWRNKHENILESFRSLL